MKMRKHHCARLKHAKGQIFTCGMFGTCSDSVLSPRTPPPALVISSPIPPPPAHNAGPAPAPVKQQQQQNVNPDVQEQQQKPLQSIKVEQQKNVSDVAVLPLSPDVVTQEKILSQWDFGLKQQIKELKEQQQQQQQDNKDLQQQQQQQQTKPEQKESQQNDGGFFKERYVGLVDRDLSPFQFSHHPRTAAIAPQQQDQSLDSLSRDTACGRFSKASLRCLRAMAEEAEKNKRSIISAGVPESLISLLLSCSPEVEKRDVLREALALLALLADDEHTQELITQSRLLFSIENDLKRRSTDAWILVCKLSTNETAINSSCTGIFDACVMLLKDPSAEAKLVRLALKSMLGICLSKQNRIPAVKAGAVEALLETLIDLHGVDGGDFCSRSGIVVNVERALATLELLCTSSEGRAAICNQPNFISELVGLVLGVSERATEYAAGVLCAVLCDNLAAESDSGVNPHGGNAAAANLTLTQLSDRNNSCIGEHSSVQEMAVKGGAPAQMLLVMQSDCSERARRKAAKLLKALHKYGEDHNTIHSDLASTITY